MSQIAEILLLTDESEAVLAPLLSPREELTNKHFVAVPGTHGWAAEFIRAYTWTPLFPLLESLPWTRPEAVQLLVHDEGNGLAGLWMFVDGRLTEVEQPGAVREDGLIPTDGSAPPERSYLYRDALPPSWSSRPETPLRPREVILLSGMFNEAVAGLLGEDDPGRPFPGRFVDIENQWGHSLGYGDAITFGERDDGSALLPYLRSLPWDRPGSVQVLIREQGAARFSLWLLTDRGFAEVPLPRGS